MSAAKKLVDMAALSCSPATQTALAKRVQVSTATISQWKKGVVPFPAERIAEFARIAHVDAAEWVVEDGGPVASVAKGRPDHTGRASACVDRETPNSGQQGGS